MLFPTTEFALFFAATLLLWWGVPRRLPVARKLVLLAANIVFYAVWSWRFALLLLASAAVNHALALAAARGRERQDALDGSDRSLVAGHWSARTATTVAVLTNLLLLAFFKYAGFLFTSLVSPVASWFCRSPESMEAWFALQEDHIFPFLSSIVLPIGISFTTFSAIAYVVDAARGTFRPANSFLDFANYLAFFPKLCAGPIARPADLIPQLESGTAQDLDLRHEKGGGAPSRAAAARATLLLCVGLLKKTVFANLVSQRLVDPFFADPSSYGWAGAALGIAGYAVQLYCDFSAYTDMAIALALLLGFSLPDNFDAPYLSRSLQEFWRRWHISLSTWLRDYLYIPLGGSRRGTWRTYGNLLLTMLLGGLWHGAGWMFLLWGALHGLGQAVERAVGRLLPSGKFRPGLLPTFLFVALAWVPFRLGTGGEDIGALSDIAAALGRAGFGACPDTAACVALALGFLSQFADAARRRPATRLLARLPAPLLGLVAAMLLTLVLGLGPRGVAPFIYFQF